MTSSPSLFVLPTLPDFSAGALRRPTHANSVRSNQTYWICTFSNNQWELETELGSGNWQESSFYKAPPHMLVNCSLATDLS